jgi:hypothetical protein
MLIVQYKYNVFTGTRYTDGNSKDKKKVPSHSTVSQTLTDNIKKGIKGKD